MALDSAASVVRHQPASRWGAQTTVCRGNVYLWGGYSKGFTNKSKNQEAEAKIERFNPIEEQWELFTTRGAVPPKVNEGACASSKNHLYTYGGNTGSSDSGCLHQLDVATLTWKEICPHKTNGPMKKIGAGMIVFEDKVLVFGGHGVPGKTIQPGSEFAKNEKFADGHGKTNELHVFDLKNGTWSSPKVTGDRPPPCVAFSLTPMSSHWAILFAGNCHDQGKTNNIFCLDLKTMRWTRRPHPKGQAAPVPREGHAAVCLNFGSLRPKLLVSGGVDINNKVLGDMWTLDTRAWSWKEVKSSAGHRPRFDHCMEAIPICPGVTEVMLFGGCPQWPKNFRSYDDFPHMAETALARFESKDWTLSNVTEFQQFGSDHRVKEKSGLVESAPQLVLEVQPPMPIILELQHSNKTAQEATERFKVAERKVTEVQMTADEEAEKRLESEQKLKENEERLQESNARVKQEANEKDQLQFELDAARQSVKEFQKKLQEKEVELENSNVEMSRREENFQQKIQQKEEHVRELQAQLTQMEERWLVSKSEISILDEEDLGKGGWGEVRVAMFRGVRVAAKSLFQSIRSKYYQQLFIREMNFASRVRHPNLVQFIGACMDDEDMLILMELMPTSLRKELERKEFHLPERVRGLISLDIVRALNYLHQMRPDAIIHRDISSANVLLEPVAVDSWRAKLTDYGSVNFQRQVKTVGPGNISYASPESHEATHQSPKMDIFSFGVLVLEMCTGKFPDITKRKLEISSLEQGFWKKLIQECVSEKPGKRPSAAQLIERIRSQLEE